MTCPHTMVRSTTIIGVAVPAPGDDTCVFCEVEALRNEREELLDVLWAIEFYNGNWHMRGGDADPDAVVTYSAAPSPETGHIGWCWWAHGKTGDAPTLPQAMALARAALAKVEKP